MKALLYVRVSTDEQKEKGISIQTQIDNLTAYCKAHNYDIKGIYNDAGKSGGSIKKRDQLQRMMTEAKSGDIVLFTKMDRLSRNLRDGLNLMHDLQERGVSFYAIDNKFGANSSPQDIAMMNMSLTFGQLERDMDGERIRDVMEGKRSRREALSGSVPLGYKIVDKHIVEDPETSWMAQFIFKRYHECGIIQQVYKELNERCGYVVRELSGYRQLLKNRMYIGEKFGEPGYCDAIIDRNLFDQVQADMAAKAVRKTRTGKVYLFSRLIICPCCGRKLYGHGYTGSDYMYYHCAARSHIDNVSTCHFKHVKEPALEQQLLEQIQDMAKNEVIKYDSFDKDIKKKKKKLEKLNEKLDRIKELYVDQAYTREKYKAESAAVNAEIIQLEAELRPVDTSAMESIVKSDIKEMYNALPKEGQREFWHRILNSITVDDDGMLAGVTFCK